MGSENSHAEQYLSVVFSFDEMNCIELDLDEEKQISGWSIIPQKYPCKVI